MLYCVYPACTERHPRSRPRLLPPSLDEMPHTVLIVDDDLDSRSICSVLLRHFGYEVIEASDGGEGVRLAKEAKPDVVVMDVTLPVLDGWDATARIKQDPETADVPVIMLTARALPSDRLKGEMAGCTSYLTKPCSPKALKLEIERLLHSGDSEE